MHDYYSPNLPGPLDPLPDFPNVVASQQPRSLWVNGMERIDPHVWYHSWRGATGSVNMDEGHLLHANALQFAGRKRSGAIEIGSAFGFSAWFILAAGVSLELCEPGMSDPGVRDEIRRSLARYDLWSYSTTPSPQGAMDLGHRCGPWAFAFIDGEHSPPYPMLDAVAVSHHMADDAIIMLHDVCYGGPGRAFSYLSATGWKGKIYRTSQFLAVCWRGAAVPATHVPDPAIVALPVPKGFDSELFF